MTKPATVNTGIVLLTRKVDIDTLIETIAKTGASLQMDMHKAACSVLAHLAKYGDIRMVQKLLNAMPASSRQNSLRKWFEAFGKVAFSGNEPVYVASKQTKLGEAMQKPFWKFTANEGAAYEPVDINVEVNKLIKRLQKDAEKTKIDHSDTIKVLKSALRPENTQPAN